MMKRAFLLPVLSLLLVLGGQAMAQLVHVQQIRTSTAIETPVSQLLDQNAATLWSDEETNVEAGTWIEVRLYEPLAIDRIELKSPMGDMLEPAEVILDNASRHWVPLNQQTTLSQNAGRVLIRLKPKVERTCVPVFDGTGFTEVCAAKSKVTLSDVLIWGPGKETPFEMKLTKEISGKVYAQSVEEPATIYHPVFLFDGRNELGWGTDHGDKGAGEALAFSFDDSVRIEKIRIVDGFAAWSGEPYVGVERMNFAEGLNKPQTLNFFPEAHWDGSFLELVAGKRGQFGEAQPGGGTWKESAGMLGFFGNLFLLRIEKTFAQANTAKILNIQELEFFDGKEWFRIKTDHKKLQEDFVRSKTQETVIGSRMDEVFHFRKDVVDVSLSFRSDGAFFMRLENFENADNVAWMHGAWENLPPKGDISVVRVLGIRQIFEGAKPLKSDVLEEIVTLEGNQIHGVQFIPSGVLGLQDDALVPCEGAGNLAIDMRYKTADNFMGEVLYKECMPCMMRKETLEALKKANALLQEKCPGKGYQFLLWDAYRPYSVQKRMWEKVPDSNYVANPYTGGSSHNKGYALDITISPDGKTSLPMGTPYDFFGEEAHHAYKKLPKKVKANRALLRSIMEEAGFVPMETEWWHYRLPGEGGIIDVDVDCE